MRKMKDSGIEWIGEIPEEWEVVNFKTIIKQNDGGVWGDDPKDDGLDSIVLRSTEQTVDGKWCIEEPAKRNLTGLSNPDYFLCKENDLLITKSSGSDLHIGKTTLVDILIEKKKYFYSNFLQRIHLQNNTNHKFYWYLLNSDIARSQFVYMQNSTSGIGNINAKYISNLKVVNAPKCNLDDIVSYLDRKCSEIDSIVRETEQTIEEYKKLKQSLITEVVNGKKRVAADGLSLSNEPRKMKNSGVEWIGEVPEEWGIQKLKYVFRIKKDIAGREVITVLSITQKGVKPKDLSKNEGQIAESYKNYQLVNKGDFAMNHMDLLTGWVDISKYDGVTSPDYRVFILLDEVANDKNYYLFLFQMCYTNRIFYNMGQGVSGMGRWRLQADKFLNFELPIPSANDQKLIANYLSIKCSEIDKLIADKQTLLQELDTYKKSLIYECVTGKREVD